MDLTAPLQALTRRELLTRGAGLVALAQLFGRPQSAAAAQRSALPPHFAPRAKRIIYLFQSGAPSQLDLFDYKPGLAARFGEELPESIRRGQRLTGMTADQAAHPVAPSKFKFQQQGQNGTWLSELLPHTGRVVDDLCLVRSVHTQAINHDPAITFLMTGTQQAGRPSLGAWVQYGLGTENENLPAFVVMVSLGTGRPNDQPLYDRLWGSGFLPTHYQGVRFRSGADPILYLSNPPGYTTDDRRLMLDALGGLNRLAQAETLDPEIEARIAQYEMAYRLQSATPELVDLAREPQWVFDLYGPDAQRPGTYAANCILARRLAERGVRCIQLFHRGWDQHRDLPNQLAGQCRDTDQATAALLTDLKQRGLLEDTLVVWGGEFGRTVYCQEALTPESYGRDHHPRCFSLWLAGGGIRGGYVHGETDDYSYNIVRDPVGVHDLHATILHCLGLDHERLTFPYLGRHFRLTDVEGQVVQPLLA